MQVCVRVCVCGHGVCVMSLQGSVSSVCVCMSGRVRARPVSGCGCGVWMHGVRERCERRAPADKGARV